MLQIAETLCGLEFQGKKKFKKFLKKNFEGAQNSPFATLLHLFFVKLFSKKLMNLANEQIKEQAKDHRNRGQRTGNKGTGTDTQLQLRCKCETIKINSIQERERMTGNGDGNGNGERMTGNGDG